MKSSISMLKVVSKSIALLIIGLVVGLEEKQPPSMMRMETHHSQEISLSMVHSSSVLRVLLQQLQEHVLSLRRLSQQQQQHIHVLEFQRVLPWLSHVMDQQHSLHLVQQHSIVERMVQQIKLHVTLLLPMQ